MKVLHILKQKPDASTSTIIEAQKKDNQVVIVELYIGGIAYDRLVADVFAFDKVYCW